MMAINIDEEGRYTFCLKVPPRLEDVTGSDIARSSKFLRQIIFIKCLLGEKGSKTQLNIKIRRTNWLLRMRRLISRKEI